VKLRLSSNKANIRISDVEWQILQKTGALNDVFKLSNTKTWSISLRLSDLNGYEDTEGGLFISIDEADFKLQKIKKDQAWQLMTGDDFLVEVEVDLKRGLI
jgi:hypothetical protein